MRPMHKFYAFHITLSNFGELETLTISLDYFGKHSTELTIGHIVSGRDIPLFSAGKLCGILIT